MLFMGMGMSGGESGARRGPSLMPGGPEQGYARVSPILEAVAAVTKHQGIGHAPIGAITDLHSPMFSGVHRKQAPLPPTYRMAWLT